jgi:quinol-cytochrome oxidoreductase complex cytochrome b subunit
MRLLKSNVLLSTLDGFIISYPAPANLSYWWNFGVLALVCLALQIITGIALAMHYVPNADLAFISVEHIMRDVNYGWLLRYIHANGASMFFIAVYLHTFRGLYYGSYTAPRTHLWGIGVIILLIMILTAFLGYVLPWGQMSFWAATVITNLASAIPVVGKHIVLWLWGGFAVDNATLNRFFSFHYLFPFILLFLVILHLVFLHEYGSNNPIGVRDIEEIDKIPFTPYFTVKDVFGIIVFLIFFGLFVFFAPNLLGHTDNYIPANPLITPAHIVPEWYFLPFYGILRSIPNKLGGVVALVLSIIVLIFLPLFNQSDIRSTSFRPILKVSFWFFVSICLLLGWIGGNPIEEPYYQIGQILTVLYFLYFILFLPLLGILDTALLSKYKVIV